MKPSFSLAIAASFLLLSGCNSQNLTREKALELITKQYPYPSVKGYYIFTDDPASSQAVIDAGMAANGYITVDKKLSLKRHPIITFTDKAKPFLLPVEEKEKADFIQRLRIAQEDIIDVTGIRLLGQGKKAIVEYTTQYKDLTPFAVLEKDKLITGKVNNRKAYLSLYDDGWRVEKNPGLDFMAE